jgi:hypothetical protein
MSEKNVHIDTGFSESGPGEKSHPKSILRTKTMGKEKDEKEFKRSATQKIVKKVTFPDRFKLPVHTVIKWKRFAYEKLKRNTDYIVKPKGVEKRCNCIII